MAIMKTRSVKKNPKKSIEYIVNDKKTMDGLLVSSQNTFSDPAAANKDFREKRQYYNCKKKNLVYTVMHSFSEKENLTPEQVHNLNLEFARRVFPKEAMWVMGTHTNEPHLHSHFCINAIMTNGKSFTPSFEWDRKAKEISNELCVEYGLMHSITVRNGRGNMKRKEYMEGLNSWKQKVRDDIDNLVDTSGSYNQLLLSLNAMGYTVNTEGKYAKVKPPGKERYVRLKTLGQWYSEEKLQQRFKYKQTINYKPFKRPSRAAERELQNCSAMLDLVIRDNITCADDMVKRYDEMAQMRNRMDIWISKAKTMPNMEDKIQEVIEKKNKIINEMNLYKQMHRLERKELER